MNWFLIAISAPILWAFVNVADSYLVSKFSDEEEKPAGALILFSCLIGIFIALGIGIFTKGVFSVSIHDALFLIVAGILSAIGIIGYLQCLQSEDVSSVVPWWLTIPVFSYVVGYLFLGETLTHTQIIGSIIIFAGAIILAIDFKNIKGIFKKTVMYKMLFSAFLFALYTAMFKYIAVEDSYWISSFWEYVGLGIFGLILWISKKSYRDSFKNMNKTGGKSILAVNIGSEVVTIAGNLLTSFASLLAPIALVTLVSSYQPIIVLILTFITTKFYPHINTEDFSKGVIMKKVVAIAVMLCGTFIILGI